ncbi:MAG: peptidoglycan DD-metalloendopeptidase family protein [Alistipes indistinctus]
MEQHADSLKDGSTTSRPYSPSSTRSSHCSPPPTACASTRFTKVSRPIRGVDYTVSEGSRVFATADGRINGDYHQAHLFGQHGSHRPRQRIRNRIQPLGQNLRGRGDRVRRGDIIAQSGNTRPVARSAPALAKLPA